jgi:hypothetical protein
MTGKLGWWSRVLLGCGVAGLGQVVVGDEAGGEHPRRHAEEDKVYVLLGGGDMEGWEAHDSGGSGMVTVTDEGTVRIGAGEVLSGIIYRHTDKLPLEHYEIVMEARRVEGADFFASLTFPLGDVEECVTLVLGGWGGSLVGISNINGMDAANNETGNPKQFKDGEWCEVVVRVSPEKLEVWIDGDSYVDVERATREFGLRLGPIEDYVPLSVTTFQTVGEVRKLWLKDLRE